MNNTTTRANIALLISRLIIGGIFINAGWMKVTDMAMTLGYFNQMNIPAFLTYIVSYGELIGGILLVIGLWSCFTTLFLGVVMINAIYFSRSMGIAGMALPLAVLGGIIALFGAGTGKYCVKIPRKQ